MADLACAGAGGSAGLVVGQLGVSAGHRTGARTSMGRGEGELGEGERKGRLWRRGWFARVKE